MPKLPLTTQAALIYEVPPEISLSDLLEPANAALSAAGLPVFEVGPAATEAFALFTAPKLHATLAIHNGALGVRGLERALAAEPDNTRLDRFETALTRGRAHMVIAVGEGPSPVRFDTPAPVPVADRLRVLACLMRCVTQIAAPMAAHVCAADRMFTPEDLETALAEAPERSLLLHPEALGGMIGPEGENGAGLAMRNAHHLIGRTLVIEGVPEPVPAEVTAKLAQTLIRQAAAGKIRLEDGASLRDGAGTTLHIRHEAPDAADPAGRVIASFWTEPAQKGAEAEPPFVPHPGYAAVPVEPPAAPEAPADAWASIAPPPHVSERPAKTGPNWMLWVGFGLFLWIGLPLLNVPKMVIESAFSSAQDNPFLDQ